MAHVPPDILESRICLLARTAHLPHRAALHLCLRHPALLIAPSGRLASRSEALALLLNASVTDAIQILGGDLEAADRLLDLGGPQTLEQLRAIAQAVAATAASAAAQGGAGGTGDEAAGGVQARAGGGGGIAALAVETAAATGDGTQAARGAGAAVGQADMLPSMQQLAPLLIWRPSLLLLPHGGLEAPGSMGAAPSGSVASAASAPAAAAAKERHDQQLQRELIDGERKQRPKQLLRRQQQEQRWQEQRWEQAAKQSARALQQQQQQQQHQQHQQHQQKQQQHQHQQHNQPHLASLQDFSACLSRLLVALGVPVARGLQLLLRCPSLLELSGAEVAAAQEQLAGSWLAAADAVQMRQEEAALMGGSLRGGQRAASSAVPAGAAGWRRAGAGKVTRAAAAAERGRGKGAAAVAQAEAPVAAFTTEAPGVQGSQQGDHKAQGDDSWANKVEAAQQLLQLEPALLQVAAAEGLERRLARMAGAVHAALLAAAEGGRQEGQRQQTEDLDGTNRSTASSSSSTGLRRLGSSSSGSGGGESSSSSGGGGTTERDACGSGGDVGDEWISLIEVEHQLRSMTALEPRLLCLQPQQGAFLIAGLPQRLGLPASRAWMPAALWPALERVPVLALLEWHHISVRLRALCALLQLPLGGTVNLLVERRALRLLLVGDGQLRGSFAAFAEAAEGEGVRKEALRLLLRAAPLLLLPRVAGALMAQGQGQAAGGGVVGRSVGGRGGLLSRLSDIASQQIAREGLQSSREWQSLGMEVEGADEQDGGGGVDDVSVADCLPEAVAELVRRAMA